ncbi:hypothetical protein WN944_029623 [Citrus x changshan-huyou]|uniref:Ubiquitin-like protease family profile domain-containing protein n=1 Tax=Citrus x changshan-huyou TaxID=2935761 RepID=A0AAP0LSW3_9ROSI
MPKFSGANDFGTYGFQSFLSLYAKLFGFVAKGNICGEHIELKMRVWSLFDSWACLGYCCFVELWSFTVLLVFKKGDETIMRMKISEDMEHILSQAEEHSRILKMKRCEEIERFLTMAQELLRFQGKKVYFEDLIYGQCDISTYITIEDCSVLAYFEELTVNCLMIWTMKLYEELKRIGMTMKYKFINPAAVSLSGRANTNKSRIDRTKIIVSQLEGIQSGQLCFMPYNPKFHWVLIVIDMDSNTIYYLDPMRQPMHMDLRLLLNNAMARLNVKESVSSNKVKVNWATVKAPRQLGNVECGFYVMSYMQDIIADNNVLKEDFFGKKTYNEEEIDEIRKEWASFVLEKL